jgi:beta-1,4-N-acetylglucosaminyltransferase
VTGALPQPGTLRPPWHGPAPRPGSDGQFGDDGGRAELLLVCSTGGHLQQLLALRHAWEGLDRLWVTFDRTDSRSLLVGERVVAAWGPTNRSVPNLVRNLALAWRVVGVARPRALLTTGAGVAVPFAWIARLRGARVIYVESFTRTESPSLSLRLIAPVADGIYAQWPELARRQKKAVFLGNVFGAG